MADDDERLDWDDLIAEAKARIKELKQSVRYWEEMRDLHEMFPLDYPKPPLRQPRIEI